MAYTIVFEGVVSERPDKYFGNYYGEKVEADGMFQTVTKSRWTTSEWLAKRWRKQGFKMFKVTDFEVAQSLCKDSSVNGTRTVFFNPNNLDRIVSKIINSDYLVLWSGEVKIWKEFRFPFPFLYVYSRGKLLPKIYVKRDERSMFMSMPGSRLEGTKTVLGIVLDFVDFNARIYRSWSTERSSRYTR